MGSARARALTPAQPSENAALNCPLWRRHVAWFSAAVDTRSLWREGPSTTGSAPATSAPSIARSGPRQPPSGLRRPSNWPPLSSQPSDWRVSGHTRRAYRRFGSTPAGSWRQDERPLTAPSCQFGGKPLYRRLPESGHSPTVAQRKSRVLNRCLTRARCDHHMKTGATVAAFARPVRLRPVDRRSTLCPRTSHIAPRTSSLAVQTQRKKLQRTRSERSAWPEPELTSIGPWQPREPMLPDDRDFGSAMARLTRRQCIFVAAEARRAGYSNPGHADAVVTVVGRHRLSARRPANGSCRHIPEPPFAAAVKGRRADVQAPGCGHVTDSRLRPMYASRRKVQEPSYGPIDGRFLQKLKR